MERTTLTREVAFEDAAIGGGPYLAAALEVVPTNLGKEYTTHLQTIWWRQVRLDLAKIRDTAPG